MGGSPLKLIWPSGEIKLRRTLLCCVLRLTSGVASPIIPGEPPTDFTLRARSRRHSFCPSLPISSAHQRVLIWACAYLRKGMSRAASLRRPRFSLGTAFSVIPFARGISDLHRTN
ncbi:uncharacterized protein EV422DRAFT_399502 [Fimicolochytrium jonesii]|uniref:uncharacterized protein n=1 Tax=Fimicolochytrium jonesii TaxID=1396493 RepID=UPI0022FE95F3|nr:uncharacterized protein EV422DRAFT_399502 [Fimicolochytrium jonesii]KAI8822462.1 hypothetical protein EV422DRAFT_399502 [Fimicolochytrium jonesii]